MKDDNTCPLEESGYNKFCSLFEGLKEKNEIKNCPYFENCSMMAQNLPKEEAREK